MTDLLFLCLSEISTLLYKEKQLKNLLFLNRRISVFGIWVVCSYERNFIQLPY